MTTQVLNFLWLNLELPPPPDPADGSIRVPLPEQYIENVRVAGARHPEAQIMLWVDKERLTKMQMVYLRKVLEEDRPNVHLQDLRTIHGYDQEKLFNEAETNPHWRGEYQMSLIWRQVDSAKILISLQGDFDQTFFADLDFANMDIESWEVQRKLGKRGLFIGSGFENQLWGFNRSRRGFFEEYYAEALEITRKRDNAFPLLRRKITELEVRERIGREELAIYLKSNGPHARQPGSRLRNGKGEEVDPLFISAAQLAEVFNNESGRKGEEPAPAPVSADVRPLSAALYLPPG